MAWYGPRPRPNPLIIQCHKCGWSREFQAIPEPFAEAHCDRCLSRLTCIPATTSNSWPIAEKTSAAGEKVGVVNRAARQPDSHVQCKHCGKLTGTQTRYCEHCVADLTAQTAMKRVIDEARQNLDHAKKLVGQSVALSDAPSRIEELKLAADQAKAAVDHLRPAIPNTPDDLELEAQVTLAEAEEVLAQISV